MGMNVKMNIIIMILRLIFEYDVTKIVVGSLSKNYCCFMLEDVVWMGNIVFITTTRKSYRKFTIVFSGFSLPTTVL